MTPSAQSVDDETIDWELDVDDSALLLALAYVFPSVFGGAIVLVCGLLIWLIGAALWAGDFGRAIGIVVVAVLALLSRRYLPALLETNVATPFFERFSRRGLLVGSLLGALALLGSVQVHSFAPYAVFIASCVPLVLTAAFPTSGHAAVTMETLVVDDTEIHLQEVRTFRTLSVDTFAVCRLSYRRGTPSAPRIIILPSDYVNVVAGLIENIPESSREEHPTIDRTERFIVGIFGLGLVAIGPLLWLALPPGDGQVIALYAGAMFGLFGALLLRYAYTA